jgi:hypothetical protein
MSTPCNSMRRLKTWQRSRLDQSEMFDWRRMFTDLGRAMAMTEPMCYSYYLASRIGSTHCEGEPDMALPRMTHRILRDADRARPTVLRNTSVVLEAVVDGRLRRKTIEVDGPENLTLNELVQAVEKAVGRRGRVSHAPVAVLRLTSVLLRPFKPGLAGRMQAAVGMATTNMAADVGRAPGWPRSLPEIRVADVIGSDLLGTR